MRGRRRERWRLEREAVVDSRPAKHDTHSAGQLHVHWHERVQALGIEPETLHADAVGRIRRRTGIHQHTMLEMVDEVAVRVLAAAAAEFGIDVDMLRSCTRRQPIATARQVAIYILRNTTDLTLTEIGDLVGRHNATVIHAIRSMEGRRRYERDLDVRIASLVSGGKIPTE